VADREARRLSFGSVADDYDRYRPSPPPQALDWLIPPGARAFLDRQPWDRTRPAADLPVPAQQAARG